MFCVKLYIIKILKILMKTYSVCIRKLNSNVRIRLTQSWHKLCCAANRSHFQENSNKFLNDRKKSVELTICGRVNNFIADVGVL